MSDIVSCTMLSSLTSHRSARAWDFKGWRLDILCNVFSASPHSPANDERPPGHPRMAFGIQFRLIFTQNYAEQIMEIHICFSFAFHFHFVCFLCVECGSGGHIMRGRQGHEWPRGDFAVFTEIENLFKHLSLVFQKLRFECIIRSYPANRRRIWRWRRRLI